MADKKSVLEEALLEAQQLEEAVKSNAKEILAATMKQEIEELVKESLNEQEEDDFVDVDEDEVSLDFEDDDDDEEYEDQEEEEFMMAPEEEEAMVSTGMSMDADEPALDLTMSSDDEVLKVFKSMGAEDGIVVTQDGDTIDIEDQEAGTEYKIELAESKLRNNLLITEDYDKNDSMDESYVEDDEMKEEMKDFDEGYGKRHMDEEDDDNETMYEIHLGEEDDDIEELDIEMGEEMDFSNLGASAKDDYSHERKLRMDGRYDAAHGDMADAFNDFNHAHALKGDAHDDRTRHYDFSEEMERDMEMGEGHMYGGNKGDESRSHRDYETNEMYGGNKGDESRSHRDYETNEMYGGNKGDESRSHRDYEANEMYGGKKGDMSKSRRDYEANEMYGGKKGDMSKSRRDYESNEGHHSDEEVGEASRTYGFGSKSGRGLRKAISNNRNYEYPMNESTKKSVNKIIATAKQLQTENRQFREKNKEYRQALKVFRDKLNEVAVFNANLAYSTKIFTEHTTTKKEKVNVLRRFDNVTTLNESKNLFNSLNSEFKSKVNKLNESVQKTITKTPSGGSSVNLIESKTYESPQITRMREIMGKL